MRKVFYAVAASLILVGLGLTIILGGFLVNEESESEYNFSFEEVSNTYGIDHEHHMNWDNLYGAQLGIGGTGIYSADYTQNNHKDILLLDGNKSNLYENTGGDGFKKSDDLPDVEGYVRSALFFDYDGDGQEDLLLMRMNDTPVLLENEKGTYKQSGNAPNVSLQVPMGAAAADYTGNGCLDLFIVQNGDWYENSPPGMSDADVPIEDDNGLPNYLFAGNCSGFTDKTEDAGIHGKHWTLSSTFLDMTDNGHPDIHVANDFNRDIFYENQGDGTFKRTVMSDSSNRNAMSSAVNDVTGNGYPDIFVTNIWLGEEMRQIEDLYTQGDRTAGNNLFLNDGNGPLEDAAEEFGVQKGGWGWAAIVEDLNNNGKIDIYHSTMDYEINQRGPYAELDEEEFYEKYPFYKYPVLLEGTDDGFSRVEADEVGLPPMDGRSVVELDLNHNGNLDFITVDLFNDFKIFENTGDTGSSIIVDVSRNEATTAIGATVTVESGGETQHRWISSNTDFLSQGQRSAHVGVGEEETATVTVEWPDGTVQTFEELDTDYRYSITPSGSIEAKSLNGT